MSGGIKRKTGPKLVLDIVSTLVGADFIAEVNVRHPDSGVARPRQIGRRPEVGQRRIVANPPSRQT